MGLRPVPIPLDEYPVHQTPLPMDRVASSDRNFYDRSYFNAHDRTGEIFLVTGLGVYPNLGVIDAYAAARCGDRQWSVRFSDALGERSLEQKVGGYQVEVVEPLRRLNLSCVSPDGGIEFDLAWTGAFPAVQEEPHLLLSGGRPILDASRFSQVGSWNGRLRVGRARLHRHWRPVERRQGQILGDPAGRRAGAAGPVGRRAAARGSGGCTCRCGSSPARSS